MRNTILVSYKQKFLSSREARRRERTATSHPIGFVRKMDGDDERAEKKEKKKKTKREKDEASEEPKAVKARKEAREVEASGNPKADSHPLLPQLSF